MIPTELTIGEVGRLLRDRSLSARALTQAHLDRIAELDPGLHAFVEVTADLARDRAEAADRDFAEGIDRGPLQGIPVGIKDVIDLAGIATACGSRARAGHVAAADAEVVRRLVSAGAVPIGKLATYEFALVGPSFDQPAPPAVNPWDPARITGGSSSGSAAAVAGGLVRAAIGTDTGGSVRSPAAYCGVVGLKPGHDRIPREGVFPLSPSLDHVGVIAATVGEAEMVFRVAAGLPLEAQRAGCEGLRIGYARDWFAGDPDLAPGVLSALDEAVSVLSLLGARIELMSLPDYAAMEAAGAVILHAEALEVHLAEMSARGRDYGRAAYQSLAGGILLSAEDLAAARAAAASFRREMSGILGRCDAVVTACTLTAAPPVESFRDGAPVWTPMRTLPFNVTGHPALSLPAGFVGGMPVGMQIAGSFGAEERICRIGRAFEAATDHSAQRPPLLRRSGA